MHRVDVVSGHHLEGNETFFEQRDRIAFTPPGNFFVGAVLDAQRLHAVVVIEAIGLGLDKRRPLAAASSGDGLSGGFVDGDNVHAVDDNAWDPVAGGSVHDIVDTHRVSTRRELAVLIVLADEDRRELQRGRHVDRFVERTDVGCSISEENDGDGVAVAVLVRERSPDRDRDTATNDAVGAEHV